MAKFLLKGSYTADGTKGLIKEGGTSRKDFVENMAKNLGGSLESFYYTLGDDDVFAIIEVPDRAHAIAVSLAGNASGAVAVSLTELIEPSELDRATKISVDYRIPGA